MSSPAEFTSEQWASKLRRSRILNAVLAVAVLFLGVVVFAQGTTGSTPAAATPSATSALVEGNRFARNDPSDPQAIGSIDAPVTLVEWTDMRCPYCAVFSRDTLPTILKEYVDTRKVRIEIHDVSYFGEQSEGASVAIRAAGRQGLAVPFVQAVFAAAPESGHPDLPEEKLVEFAKTAGVPDLAAFTTDLKDPELRTAAQQSTTTAQKLGVSSVPFFTAGGQALSGAQPIEVFRQYLDAAVEQAG